jgi:hypothetical protein
LFTPLSLLYNLILAGINCKDAKMKVYKYNISVITRKKWIDKFLELKMDKGDIEYLREYFPCEVWQGISGNHYQEVNWS